MSRLDEIKARADAATLGPWVRDMHSPDMSGRSGWYIRGPRGIPLAAAITARAAAIRLDHWADELTDTDDRSKP